MQYIIKGDTSPALVHNRGPSFHSVRLAIALLLYIVAASFTVLRLDNGLQSVGQTTVLLKGHFDSTLSEYFNQSLPDATLSPFSRSSR